MKAVEFFKKYNKENNPFYPNDMRWTRRKIYEMLILYDKEQEEHIISLREKLADFAHSQWSGWMEYLFSKCQFEKAGTIMPGWAVIRWHKQMKTAYKDLSKEEKESDRKEADKIIEILKELE